MTPPPKLAGVDLSSAKQGRWKKADQFAEAASLFFDEATQSSDLSDAFVTLAVHSGIASADVICISALQEFSTTSNHEDGARLLEKADPTMVKHLRRLLQLKSKAGYKSQSVSGSDVQQAQNAHKALLERAGQVR